MEPTRRSQVRWNASDEQGSDAIDDELLRNAERMARFVRANLELPGAQITCDLAQLEIEWVDGPAQLPAGAMHFIHDAFDVFGLGFRLRRRLSVVVFAAAAIDHYANGELERTELWSKSWQAITDRDWCTDTPYGRHRTLQAETLCVRAAVPLWGVVDLEPDAGFDVDLIDALLSIDADRIDEVLDARRRPA